MNFPFSIFLFLFFLSFSYPFLSLSLSYTSRWIGATTTEWMSYTNSVTSLRSNSCKRNMREESTKRRKKKEKKKKDKHREYRGFLPHILLSLRQFLFLRRSFFSFESKSQNEQRTTTRAKRRTENSFIDLKK